MAIQTNGVGHIAIRVTDRARAKEFYVGKLGFQQVLENEEILLLNAGGTFLGIRGAAQQTAAGDTFDPFRVGLDHIALHVDPGTLEELKSQLDAAGAPNNGIQNDELLGARYISFYDPDGIAWELYGLPEQS